MTSQLSARDFHVGWICAVEIEYTISQEMLDEEYDDDAIPIDHGNDDNVYTFGRIGKHNVVLACLPKGKYGLVSAAYVANNMRRSFPSICIGLMVGIGGGAPSEEHDIRLGDVVVSVPAGRTTGIIPYEYGKTIQNRQFRHTRAVNAPPAVLLNATQKLSSLHKRGRQLVSPQIDCLLERNPRLRREYSRPSGETDKLFRSEFIHPHDSQNCVVLCYPQIEQTVSRAAREEDEDLIKIHYGIVASSDRLVKDAQLRDQFSREEGAICFEMEAAGLDQFPSIIIRGICDYSDTHKNDIWQGHAAAAAAAYAKQLLATLPSFNVEQVFHDIAQRMERSHTQLGERINEESQLSRNLMEMGFNSTRDHVTNTLQNLEGKILTQNLRDRLLESLKFPEMNLRFNEVHEPHQQTFDWILKDNEPNHLESFTQWLKSGERIYWIKGKAGAGKSTLMKFLVGKMKAGQLKSKTSVSEPDPIVLKYFFWLHGSHLQRTLKGFLSSLLFQLMSTTKQSLNERFLQSDFVRKESQADWSTDELINAFTTCIRLLSRSVWIFVDGLDEADKNDKHRMTDVLGTIRGHPNIKLCVSSRPELGFASFFKGIPHLSLESMTEPDMRKCIDDCIQKHIQSHGETTLDEHLKERLTDTLLVKADGVFLWIHLALQNINEGFIGSDDFPELLKRLDALPSEIENLYSHMWDRVNHDLDSYRRDAATYFSLLLSAAAKEAPRQTDPVIQNFNCFQMLAASDVSFYRQLLLEDRLSPLRFEFRLQKFKTQVLTRAAGLIEFSDVASDLWKIAVSQRETSRGWKDYFQRPRFIHRSAADFLLGSSKGKEILSWSDVDAFEAERRIFRAKCLSHKLGLFNLTHDTVSWLFWRVPLGDEEGCLEDLDFMVKFCGQAVLATGCHQTTQDWFFPLKKSPRFEIDWGLKWSDVRLGLDSIYAYYGCLSHFQRLHQTSNAKLNKSFLDASLSEASHGSAYRKVELHFRMRLMHWLLDQGANPNARRMQKINRSRVISYTAWAYLLLDLINTHATDTVDQANIVSLLQHFLSEGASMHTKTLVILLCETGWSLKLVEDASFGYKSKPTSWWMVVEVNMTELFRLAVLGQRLTDHPSISPVLSNAKLHSKAMFWSDMGRQLGKLPTLSYDQLRRINSTADSEKALALWNQGFADIARNNDPEKGFFLKELVSHLSYMKTTWYEEASFEALLEKYRILQKVDVANLRQLEPFDGYLKERP